VLASWSSGNDEMLQLHEARIDSWLCQIISRIKKKLKDV
jgi:hypothetical protein